MPCCLDSFAGQLVYSLGGIVVVEWLLLPLE